jgi:hypothetical protein
MSWAAPPGSRVHANIQHEPENDQGADDLPGSGGEVRGDIDKSVCSLLKTADGRQREGPLSGADLSIS